MCINISATDSEVIQNMELMGAANYCSTCLSLQKHSGINVRNVTRNVFTQSNNKTYINLTKMINVTDKYYFLQDCRLIHSLHCASNLLIAKGLFPFRTRDAYVNSEMASMNFWRWFSIVTSVSLFPWECIFSSGRTLELNCSVYALKTWRI